MFKEEHVRDIRPGNIIEFDDDASIPVQVTQVAWNANIAPKGAWEASFILDQTKYKIPLPQGVADISDFRGIRLTKELLIDKCGAKDTAGDYQNITIHDTMWISFHEGKLFLVTAAWAGRFVYHHHELPYKHLHQLQNLYYSLYGKEMPVKF